MTTSNNAEGQSPPEAVAPTPSSPEKGDFPGPDEVVVGNEEQNASESKESYKPVPYFVCQNCGKEFRMHIVRTGVPIFWLMLILLASIFIVLLLIFFVCFCDSYEVCPKCGEFSGNIGSKNKGICIF